MKQPCYLGLEDARQVLAEMGVNLSLRQMQRAAEQDAQGRRKLPFFVDPIEHKLKIEKDDLLSAYFKRQVEASIKLILPLLGETSGTHDQAPLQVAPNDEFLDKQSGHDRLPGSRIVGQQKTQWLTQKHLAVNRSDLMRQRLNN